MEEETNATAKPEIAHVLAMDVVGYSQLLIDRQVAVAVVGQRGGAFGHDELQWSAVFLVWWCGTTTSSAMREACG